MGLKTNQAFSELGSKTFIGISGNPDIAMDKYIKGELTNSDSFCKH